MFLKLLEMDIPELLVVGQPILCFLDGLGVDPNELIAPTFFSNDEACAFENFQMF